MQTFLGDLGRPKYKSRCKKVQQSPWKRIQYNRKGCELLLRVDWFESGRWRQRIVSGTALLPHLEQGAILTQHHICGILPRLSVWSEEDLECFEAWVTMTADPTINEKRKKRKKKEERSLSFLNFWDYFILFCFYFLATPVAYGISQAKDRNWIATATCVTAAAMWNP